MKKKELLIFFWGDQDELVGGDGIGWAQQDEQDLLSEKGGIADGENSL